MHRPFRGSGRFARLKIQLGLIAEEALYLLSNANYRLHRPVSSHALLEYREVLIVLYSAVKNYFNAKFVANQVTFYKKVIKFDFII